MHAPSLKRLGKLLVTYVALLVLAEIFGAIMFKLTEGPWPGANLAMGIALVLPAGLAAWYDGPSFQSLSYAVDPDVARVSFHALSVLAAMAITQWLCNRKKLRWCWYLLIFMGSLYIIGILALLLFGERTTYRFKM